MAELLTDAELAAIEARLTARVVSIPEKMAYHDHYREDVARLLVMVDSMAAELRPRGSFVPVESEIERLRDEREAQAAARPRRRTHVATHEHIPLGPGGTYTKVTMIPAPLLWIYHPEDLDREPSARRIIPGGWLHPDLDIQDPRNWDPDFMPRACIATRDAWDAREKGGYVGLDPADPRALSHTER